MLYCLDVAESLGITRRDSMHYMVPFLSPIKKKVVVADNFETTEFDEGISTFDYFVAQHT